MDAIGDFGLDGLEDLRGHLPGLAPGPVDLTGDGERPFGERGVGSGAGGEHREVPDQILPWGKALVRCLLLAPATKASRYETQASALRLASGDRGNDPFPQRSGTTDPCSQFSLSTGTQRWHLQMSRRPVPASGSTRPVRARPGRRGHGKAGREPGRPYRAECRGWPKDRRVGSC